MKIKIIQCKFVAAYGLIEKNQAVLVDTGLPGNEEKILRAFGEESISPKDIKLIILTHAHPDHTGSAPALKKITGAPIGIHKEEAPFLRDGIAPPVVPANLLGRILRPFAEKQNKKIAPTLEADILFEDAFSLEPYGFPARVIATPGHTSGSVSVFTDQGEGIVGDILMKKFMGSGKAALPLFAVDMKQVIRSLKTILAQNPKRLFTAHSGEVKVQELKRLVQDIF